MRFAFLCLAACSYRPTAATAVVDGEVEIDAPACASTCQDSATLLDCVTGQPVACPLGCLTDHCGSPVPSNGASGDDLAGVTKGLDVTESSTFDTTTGGIVTDGGTVVRPPGIGVLGGLAFLDRNGVAILGVGKLTIENGVVLRVAGSRPVIVLARGDIDIEGRLDASGGVVPCGLTSTSQCGGPGAGSGGAPDVAGTGCSPGGAGFDGSGDETGGGGGGYGSPKGGDGGASGNPGGIGGGGNCSTQEVVPLVGGSGGGGGGGSNGGVGGGGGGAIQLTALGHLRVTTPGGGTLAGIVANGAGGRHGPSGTGGGGAGSAGAILLEAQSVTITDAVLAANAGSGGAGDNGGDGNNGRLDTQGAAGGTGPRPGGSGAARQGSPGAGGGTGDGTGGGGGGIGRIFINTADGFYQLVGGAVVSPVEYAAIPPVM